MKAAIIGSGIGGLAVSLRLSKFGYDVEVFEKNEIPGGKANQIFEKGFRFDTGPSLITMPFVIENLFNDLGLNVNEYLDLNKLDINCKYYFPDSTVFFSFTNQTDFVNEVHEKFGEPKENILKFLHYSKSIYDLTSNIFLFNSLHQISTYLNLTAFKSLLNLRKIDVNRRMHETIKAYFKNPKTHQLFNRYATYNGSNPYMAPATLNIIQHVENYFGAYINKKGIYNIVEVLYELAKKQGVKFHFNSEIDRIILNNNTVTGIKHNNSIKYFDKVVSNADANFTYNKLLQDITSKDAVKYSKMEPSSSALIFFWGVKGTFEQMEIHNILFSENYEQEFYQLFNENKVPDDPTIYIYISSKFNKQDALSDHENWFVMINTPPNNNQNWQQIIIEVKEKIISKINKTLKIDLNDKIVFEKIISPKDLEINTNSSFGSIYGIASNSKTTAFLRQRNKSNRYNNLFFVGGSAHPGGGIPLVLLSAKITSELIYKDKID